MPEESWFQKTLSDFTFNVASGDAIRHLADHGYTAQEILKKLDFPTPFDRVQDVMWRHFLEQGIVTFEEPGLGSLVQKAHFETVYDQFGRKSFIQVVDYEEYPEPIMWKTSLFSGNADDFRYLLSTGRVGEQTAYASVDFGLRSKREPEAYAKALEYLEPGLRNYVLGMPWERKKTYHRLDNRMREILTELYAAGEYQGWLYFLSRQEKVQVLLGEKVSHGS